MATFGQWLLVQEDQVGSDGEPTQTARLASAWRGDPDRGNTSSPAGMKRHIASRWPEHGEDGRPDRDVALAWLSAAQEAHRAQRHLQPAAPEAPAADSAQLGRIEQELAWIKAALAMILPDDALLALQTAEETDAEHDFAGMWAKADHSGDIT